MARQPQNAQWHLPKQPENLVDSEDREFQTDVEKEEEAARPEGLAEREERKLGLLFAQLERWTASMERLRLADYVRYVDDRKQLFWSNFWGGIARGVGMAIGFSVLGALLVWILQDLAKRNLPLIGDILAYIMEAIRPD